MQVCVIVNPRAGRFSDLATIEAALAGLHGAELHVTAGPGDATGLARRAAEEGCELVVAAGGDGTLNEVVNGLVPPHEPADRETGATRRPRLALLPLGTGNDFARTIEVPADTAEALEVLARGRTAQVDVGRLTVGGAARSFINVSGGGFSGSLDAHLDARVKRAWGPLSYLRTAIEALPELGTYDLAIELDGGAAGGGETLELAVYSVLVANGRHVAAGIPVAPEARLDDGLLDLLVIPAASVPQLAVLVPQILLGRHLDSDLVAFHRAARIAIRSQPAMWFNADGELVGRGPAVYEVLPRALEVVVGWEDGPRQAA